MSTDEDPTSETDWLGLLAESEPLPLVIDSLTTANTKLSFPTTPTSESNSKLISLLTSSSA